MVACWLTLFIVAVTVAFWLPLTVPEAAAKVALICPATTATLVGMESNALSLTSVTIAVLVEAVFKVMAHVLEALLPRVEGEQATELSCAGALPVAVSVNVLETLFKVAVNRAF
jgi:hypothetical protein